MHIPFMKFRGCADDAWKQHVEVHFVFLTARIDAECQALRFPFARKMCQVEMEQRVFINVSSRGNIVF